jgi:hypothetical protein
MQTLRVVVLLLIVAVAILAYALWGRAGRERNAALPQQEPVIPVSRLTEVKPVKRLTWTIMHPICRRAQGKMSLRRSVSSAIRLDICSTSPHFRERPGRLRYTRWSRVRSTYRSSTGKRDRRLSGFLAWQRRYAGSIGFQSQVAPLRWIQQARFGESFEWQTASCRQRVRR